MDSITLPLFILGKNETLNTLDYMSLSNLFNPTDELLSHEISLPRNHLKMTLFLPKKMSSIINTIGTEINNEFNTKDDNYLFEKDSLEIKTGGYIIQIKLIARLWTLRVGVFGNVVNYKYSSLKEALRACFEGQEKNEFHAIEILNPLGEQHHPIYEIAEKYKKECDRKELESFIKEKI